MEKEVKPSRSGVYSDEYHDWVKQANLKPLTNTQHHFAEFLLEHADEIKKIGDLTTIFISVRKYLRNGSRELRN
jgi:hypothetical protein